MREVKNINLANTHTFLAIYSARNRKQIKNDFITTSKRTTKGQLIALINECEFKTYILEIY